jgi:hypothetical protein
MGCQDRFQAVSARLELAFAGEGEQEELVEMIDELVLSRGSRGGNVEHPGLDWTGLGGKKKALSSLLSPLCSCLLRSTPFLTTATSILWKMSSLNPPSPFSVQAILHHARKDT